MPRFLLAAACAALLSLTPHVTRAEGEATAKGKTCSESSGGTSKASAGGVEKDAKKAVQQMDKTSTDTVTVGKDGKVTVASQCNPKCIGDKLKDAQGKPSTTPCPAGRVLMSLPNGTVVSCTKDKEECGKITGTLQEAPEVVEAVTAGSADAVAKSVAQALANSEGARAALEKGTQSVLDSAFASKVPEAVKTAVQEGVGSMLDSIAKGDFDAAAATGKEVKDALEAALKAAGVTDAVKDPQSFARLFGPEAAKAMGGAQAAGQLFCGMLGDACPEGMRQFAGGSTFGSGQPKVDVTWPGGSSPYLIQQRATLMAELDTNRRLRETVAAVISTEMGGGGPGSQAVLEAMVNRCVQMGCKSLQQAIYNGFYGPVNRGAVASYLARGVSAADLSVADTAIQAVRGGSNLIDFRTDQGMRNEVRGPRVANFGGEWFADMNGNASWANRQKQAQSSFDASHPDAVVPPSPTHASLFGGVGQQQSGGVFGAVLGGSKGASPFAAIGGAGGSLFSGLLGGGSGGSSPLGMLGNLFGLGGGSRGSGGGSSGGGSGSGSAAPASSVQPPTVTAPRPVTSAPAAGSGVVAQAPDPVMTLSAPSSAKRGTSFAISWAALNVQASTCVVKEGTTERGKGSLGSYTATAPTDTSVTSVKFTFSCFSLGAKDTNVVERMKTVALTQ